MLEDGGGRTVSQEGSGFQEPRLELEGGTLTYGTETGSCLYNFPIPVIGDWAKWNLKMGDN